MQDSKEVREIAKTFREAADVLDFAKSLTEEQKSNLETLLRGVWMKWQTSQKTARK